MVRIQPDPPRFGGVAQLGERLLCKQEVIGSIPFTSTLLRADALRSASPATAKQCALRSAKREGGLDGGGRGSKRQRIDDSVRYRLAFRPKAVSIFNNSEEAKRINSANVSARGWCRVVIAFSSSQHFENGERGRLYPGRRLREERRQGYRIKRLSACGGCLGDHRR